MASSVIPAIRYDNAPRMIDWIGVAFGFERHLVVEDGSGGIALAQLRRGDGIVMVGSSRDDELGNMVRTPGLIGAVTQCTYAIVPDVDALSERAVQAGAKVAQEVCDVDHGGRSVGCFDPEGHLWFFGSYDP